MTHLKEKLKVGDVVCGIIKFKTLNHKMFVIGIIIDIYDESNKIFKLGEFKEVKKITDKKIEDLKSIEYLSNLKTVDILDKEIVWYKKS